MYSPVLFHDPAAPHQGGRFGFRIAHDLRPSGVGGDDRGQVTHRAHAEVPEVAGAKWGGRHCCCIFSLLTFRQAMLKMKY